MIPLRCIVLNSFEVVGLQLRASLKGGSVEYVRADWKGFAWGAQVAKLEDRRLLENAIAVSHSCNTMGFTYIETGSKNFVDSRGYRFAGKTVGTP